MYFDVACFQLVFDFPCFGLCSERFQGKRFQGMRVLRKSSFCVFSVILFIHFSTLTSGTSSYIIIWLKVVQRKLQVNLDCFTKCYDHPVNSPRNINTLTSRMWREYEKSSSESCCLDIPPKGHVSSLFHKWYNNKYFEDFLSRRLTKDLVDQFKWMNKLYLSVWVFLMDQGYRKGLWVFSFPLCYLFSCKWPAGYDVANSSTCSVYCLRTA